MPKSVVVIEPSVVSRIHRTSVLEGGHYTVAALTRADEMAKLPSEPDLVLAALSDEAPSAAVRALRAALGRCDAPVLVLDRDPTPLRRLAALRAGAREVLPRNIPDALLLARLRGLIREGEAGRECERRRITAASFGLAEAPAGFDAGAVVVTVDPTGALPGLQRILSATPGHKIRAQGASDVLCDTGGEDRADAYVVVSGQNTSALDRLLPELRDRSHSRRAPVMAICPADRPDIATRALDLGASDIAAETASGEELTLRIDAMLTRKRQRDALRRSTEHSYRLAATDPLTGLYNRRYAEAYLGDLMMQAGQKERSFVVMLVDLDHFKTVNDRYGHAAGDQVLCEVSHRLRDNLRACDLISRHGGEEFLVILPETRADEAARTAERLRAAVESVPVVLGKDRQVTVTASIGVAGGRALERLGAAPAGALALAEKDMPLPALSRILEAADTALYRAKDCGRNRVEFSAA